MTRNKPTHGGKRKGAGRKPGKNKPNPTKVMRIPLPLVEHIKEIIERYKVELEKKKQ